MDIACSLDAGDFGGRVEEWRALLSRTVVGTRWISDSTVRFELDADADALGQLATLVHREVECCPFFVFGLDVAAPTITLRVSVPPDAEPILKELAALATDEAGVPSSMRGVSEPQIPG